MWIASSWGVRILKMITLIDPRKARVLYLVAEIYFLCSKACILHSLVKIYIWTVPEGTHTVSSCTEYLWCLSVLKLGSYPPWGSKYTLASASEWNERLSPFKFHVPKLLNIKMVLPWIKKNKYISICISFDMRIILSEIVYCVFVTCLLCIHYVHCLPTWCTYGFCQWVESMHFYKRFDCKTHNWNHKYRYWHLPIT